MLLGKNPPNLDHHHVLEDNNVQKLIGRRTTDLRQYDDMTQKIDLIE